MAKEIKKEKIEIEIPSDIVKEGKPITIIKTNDRNEEYVLSNYQLNNEELDLSQQQEFAEYNFNSNKHLIDKIIEEDKENYITSNEKITRLAKDIHRNVESVKDANAIIEYYINSNDLIGRALEIIQNNINTKYTLTFPTSEKKKDIKDIKRTEEIINDFLKDVDIENQIKKECIGVFSKGNYFTYLKTGKDGRHSIVNYPLNIAEVSDYLIDGEPLLMINVQNLRNSLIQTQSKYINVKTKFFSIPKNADEEIKRNYPPEVFQANEDRSFYAFLNPKRTGCHRINNLNGLYGVSPIFKALTSLLMLETIDSVDRDNIIAKAKKIVYQKTRKELMGKDYSQTKKFQEVAYAQKELVKAMSLKTVIYTSPPYVEDVEFKEPKTELTDTSVITANRNKILNSIGISFLSNESKSSFNSVEVSVDELLKMIDYIVKQFSDTINKYIKTVCEENEIDLKFAPVFKIETTQMMDMDTKLKFVELLYSKIGVSYKTIFEQLGMDCDTEIQRRKQENNIVINKEKTSVDEIMFPHMTSFTASGESESNTDSIINDDTNSNNSKKTDNEEKNNYDKQRYESNSKS